MSQLSVEWNDNLFRQGESMSQAQLKKATEIAEARVKAKALIDLGLWYLKLE